MLFLLLMHSILGTKNESEANYFAMFSTIRYIFYNAKMITFRETTAFNFAVFYIVKVSLIATSV